MKADPIESLEYFQVKQKALCVEIDSHRACLLVYHTDMVVMI